LDTGVKVIDLSADYRLEKDVYEKVYGKKHEGYVKAVYGLTEIHRTAIGKSKLVANPGCYPTGCILAVAPISNFIKSVVFDCKSGITGAGMKPTEFTHYPNLHENVIPYKITNHRHYHEIVQELRSFNRNIRIEFTPQVFPGSRGILTTAYVQLKEDLDVDEIWKIYGEFYKDCYFIRFQESVRLSYVRGSNFCDISIHKDEDRLVVVSAIDNLVKGASGQAIQNMNVMFGWDEKIGLDFPPLFP
jgi:N-acetyl-gamma-glutamyl-phosphate reductase